MIDTYNLCLLLLQDSLQAWFTASAQASLVYLATHGQLHPLDCQACSFDTVFEVGQLLGMLVDCVQALHPGSSPNSKCFVPNSEKIMMIMVPL